jgi:hypothetical protein
LDPHQYGIRLISYLSIFSCARVAAGHLFVVIWLGFNATLCQHRRHSTFLTMSEALDPSVIITTINDILPLCKKSLSAPQDGIAALLHSAMTILGFRLVGLDDSSPDVQHEQNVLPEEWSKNSPDSFAFRYRHDQSSLVFLLKVVKLSKRIVIHGIALEVHNWFDTLRRRYNKFIHERRTIKLLHLISSLLTSRLSHHSLTIAAPRLLRLLCTVSYPLHE